MTNSQHNGVALLWGENNPLVPRSRNGPIPLLQPANRTDFSSATQLTVMISIDGIIADGQQAADFIQFSIRPKLYFVKQSTNGWQYTEPRYVPVPDHMLKHHVVGGAEGWFTPTGVITGQVGRDPSHPDGAAAPIQTWTRQTYYAVIKDFPTGLAIDFGELNPGNFTITGGTNPRLRSSAEIDRK